MSIPEDRDRKYAVVPRTLELGEEATRLRGLPAAVASTPGTTLALHNFTGLEILRTLADLSAEPEPWVIAAVECDEGSDAYRVKDFLDTPVNLEVRIGPQAEQLCNLAWFWLDGRYTGHRSDRWSTNEIVEAAGAHTAGTAALVESGLEWGWNKSLLKYTGDFTGLEFTALAARHLITEGTPWDQAAYDALTMPYRRTVGPLHPDDAPSGVEGRALTGLLVPTALAVGTSFGLVSAVRAVRRRLAR